LLLFIPLHTSRFLWLIALGSLTNHLTADYSAAIFNSGNSIGKEEGNMACKAGKGSTCGSKKTAAKKKK
jgi:hypothetical protein